MGTEIERKFLVNEDLWVPPDTYMRCTQGYLAVGPPVAVRVRMMGDIATLNIKRATLDIERMEFEYEIPVTDARELLAHACLGHPIEKTRYVLEHERHKWEIDVFEGRNKGLIVAEIELRRRDETFAKPAWVGKEVSGDPRYLNTHLCLNPYTQWEDR
ncbi:MAG: CYTH domain-containing protein [Candidatus Hydrogenedentes bacterium]|nr:CYTH domain-containing protein [Candidatus Hydrogenedentota bacterium]